LPGASFRAAASLRSTLVFSLLGAGLAVAARQGWVTIYRDFEEAGPVYFILSLALMLVAHDTYFYWTHRAMHHRRLFALFHRTHHLSRTPTVWAAYSFSVPEAIVQGVFVPLFVAVVPVHALTLFIFVAIQIVRNVMGHSGTELHPAAFGPGRWLGWNNTTTYHDLHHETGRGNYSLYFRWWDQLMGTEHPDYRHKFESIVAPRHALQTEVRS
jgi:lathosterol oxidase